MKKPIEPMWWSLFGAGGAISAIFLPVLILVTGIAFPLGWMETSHEHLRSMIDPWYSRLLILAIISLSLFHWAHRFRFTLHEGLQLQAYDKLIAAICYGASIILTGITGFILFTT